MCGTIPADNPPVDTYGAAATSNVKQTALEAGNSTATIFSHDRALATEDEGKAWFSILPSHSVSRMLRPPRATRERMDPHVRWTIHLPG